MWNISSQSITLVQRLTSIISNVDQFWGWLKHVLGLYLLTKLWKNTAGSIRFTILVKRWYAWFSLSKQSKLQISLQSKCNHHIMFTLICVSGWTQLCAKSTLSDCTIWSPNLKISSPQHVKEAESQMFWQQGIRKYISKFSSSHIWKTIFSIILTEWLLEKHICPMETNWLLPVLIPKYLLLPIAPQPHYGDHQGGSRQTEHEKRSVGFFPQS